MTKTTDIQENRIDIFKQLADNKNGKCLSDTYVNSTTKLLFICKNNHQWLAFPSNVLRGHWCKRCSSSESNSKKKDSIQLYKKIALDKGGKCLSDTYSTQNDKLLFECASKHQWWGRPSKIKRGEWCRKCSYKIISQKNRLDIKILKDLAESKGGKLLSTTYESINKKLLWECGEKHQWWTTGVSVRAGRWCKECSAKNPYHHAVNVQGVKWRIKGSTKTTHRHLEDKINDLIDLAKKRQGYCLSDKYLNSQTNLTWKCKNGHIWQATPANIKKGTWCRICATKEIGIKRSTPLEFFKQYAISKAGQCLSDSYTNQESLLTFQCSKGHTWKVRGGSIKGKRTWCMKCVGKYKADTPELQAERLSEIKALARNNGGECLSEEYKNQKIKLQFRCSNGHTWWTIPSVLKRGSWCKKCATKRASDGQRDNLELFKKIIENRGGKCLTTEYESQEKTRILVECDKGHKWLAFPQHLKRGIWCRKCNGSAPHTLEDVRKLVESRGGKLLSTEYKNDMTKIICQCAENHIWEISPNNMKRGKWCPTCNSGIGERVCRLAFEKIFQKHFNKVRPHWLKNNSGFVMELDGYNEELKLAFEHQGTQHYSEKTNHRFVKINLLQNDKEKFEICKSLGVSIVYIPEVFTDTKLNDLLPFIRQQLDKLKISYPTGAKQITLDPREVYTYTKTKEVEMREKRALEILNNRGATPIEIFRVDSGVRVKVRCNHNHTLKTNISTIINGTHCKKCKGQ